MFLFKKCYKTGKLPSVKNGEVYRWDRFWEDDQMVNFGYPEFKIFIKIK